MARSVVIGHNTFKRRSPLGVWLGLPLITFGIYPLVWYYKINNEAKQYLADDTIKPGIALLAITFGAILVLPPFISVYRTCKRIRRMQEQAGVKGLIEPPIGVLLMFLFSFHYFYLQSHLNRIWDAHLATDQAPAPAPPPLPAPT
jgi:hypothetical protein